MRVSVATELRHELHRYPETSGNEKDTARKIITFLSELNGWEITQDVGGFGILATYDSGKVGTHTAFRAELDALPIQEQTGVMYASAYDGVAHLCGHDGHMAILCGFAEQLSRYKLKSGRITLLFQPAEETGEGAAAMLADNAMAGFRPDRIIALHNIPGEVLGTVLIKSGTMLVASTGAEIRFKGESSHAAEPEKGRPAWPALRTLCDEALAWSSTNVALHEQAKITLVGCSTGGPHYGTAAGDGTIWFTLRAYQTATLNMLKSMLIERARSIASLYNLSASVSFVEEFDATVNDAKLTDAYSSLLMDTQVPIKELVHPYSYSEDFGRFSGIAPTLFFGLGAGTDCPPLHSGGYDFPDSLIEKGIHIFNLIVSKYHQ